MFMKDDDALPTSKSLSQLKISNQGDGLVVQSNKLIDAAYKLSLEEMRLLYISLKKINPKMELGPDGLMPEIVISVTEYRDAFGIRTNALYDRLSETANALLMKPLTTFDWNADKQKMDKTKRVWFTSLAYDAEGDVSSIKLRFSPELRPFIYELTTNFTRIEFEQLSRLDTPFSMRLYQWLVKFKGLRKSNKGDGVYETEAFEIDDLKSKTGLDNKYKEFKFFKRDMLDPAINRINNQTDLSVSYKLIKEGRAVKKIVFVFISDKETVTAKPLRPRLPGRPRVVKDSDAEGLWARECIKILEKYQTELLAYDNKSMLPIRDAEKLVSYYRIIGDKDREQKLSMQLESRRMTKAE